MDEEEMGYKALAALEPEARMHPTLGVLVSPSGRVLLPGRKGHAARWTYGRTCTLGYKVVDIRQLSYYVHRLVAETFLGLAPEGKPQVDHIDRNRANNCLENLHWVSATENALNKASNVQDLIKADPQTYCNTSYRRRVGVRLGLTEKRPRGRTGNYAAIVTNAPRAADGYPIVPRRLRHNATFRQYLRAQGIACAHYLTDDEDRGDKS